MKLYLLRHAEAHPGFPDESRDLTEKGIRQATNLAKFLKNKKVFTPKIIYHSYLNRAAQTASIVAETLGLASQLKQVDNLKPNDDIDYWLKSIRTLQNPIALVGHNPHLSLLANRLLSGDENRGTVDLSKGALLCLERQDVYLGLGKSQLIWSVRWHITPRLLEQSD